MFLSQNNIYKLKQSIIKEKSWEKFQKPIWDFQNFLTLTSKWRIYHMNKKIFGQKWFYIGVSSAKAVQSAKPGVSGLAGKAKKSVDPKNIK